VNQPNSVNPNWEPLLNALPEAMHSIVTPHLQKWDQQFQSEVQGKINEALKPYEPYKVLVDNNVPMERIDETLRFVYTLETDPENTVKNLAEHFKIEVGTPAPEGNEPDPFNLDDEDNEMPVEDSPAFK